MAFDLEILTLEEVAKIMKVSNKTVYRWIASKRLRAAKMGRKTYRILAKDLRRFINSHLS